MTQKQERSNVTKEEQVEKEVKATVAGVLLVLLLASLFL